MKSQLPLEFWHSSSRCVLFVWVCIKAKRLLVSQGQAISYTNHWHRKQKNTPQIPIQQKPNQKALRWESKKMFRTPESRKCQITQSNTTYIKLKAFFAILPILPILPPFIGSAPHSSNLWGPSARPLWQALTSRSQYRCWGSGHQPLDGGAFSGIVLFDVFCMISVGLNVLSHIISSDFQSRSVLLVDLLSSMKYLYCLHITFKYCPNKNWSRPCLAGSQPEFFWNSRGQKQKRNSNFTGLVYVAGQARLCRRFKLFETILPGWSASLRHHAGCRSFLRVH